MEDNPTNKPWLIAAWPGMGNVALIAAGYLMQKLGLEPAGEMAAHPAFDVTDVQVKKGLIEPPRLPRGVFFRRTGATRNRELIVFLGEAQPSHGGFSYAQALLQRAAEMGVERVVTFASLATQLHPSQEPRVFAAATTHDMLAELKRLGVQPVDEGTIGGLNGLVAAAAAEQNIEGVCLLGEMPYFAATVMNPHAAKAVLETFVSMAGIEFDLSDLSEQAQAVDKFLIEAAEKLKRRAEASESESEAEDSQDEPEPSTPREAKAEKPSGPKPPDLATRNRIETLFEEARKDRSKAATLKHELDRLGVFALYEDRFLDLFRRAN